MKRLTRCAVVAVILGTAASVSIPSALADGKAQLGCSSPYTLATISDIDAFTQPLVTAGFFTQDSLMALLVSLDHNADGSLCYKTPDGWFGPPATSGAHRSGFVNLVDDKVIG
jgi:hypothetical protein